MAREYGKVFSKFWSSPTVLALSEDARTLALYLLTCEHGTIAGVFRLPDGYVSEDLRWSSERVRKGFDELHRNGFATRCETTKWVWVVRHLEWNHPENPNQLKSAAKRAGDIPRECSWRPDFMRVCAESLGVEYDPDEDGSRRVSELFANPSLTSSSSSSSSSNSNPKSKDADPAKSRQRSVEKDPSLPKSIGVRELVALGIDRAHAEDWLKARKTKRLPLTQSALDLVIKQAEKAGKTLAQVIAICASNGWAGYNPKWETGGSRGAAPAPDNFSNRDYGDGGEL